MINFFKNWNFKKHFATVAVIYTILGSLVNSLMLMRCCKKTECENESAAKWVKYVSPEEKKKAALQSFIQEPDKSVTLINGIMGVMFLLDLAAYPIVKHVAQRIK